jgi:hypothetical protein
MVRGLHTNLDPEHGPFEIQSFRIRDYAGRAGSNVELTDTDFAGNWLRPLNTPSAGDRFNGKLVVVTLDASTIAATLNCVPTVGTVPFNCTFSAMLTSMEQSRPATRAAARIDVLLANGTGISNWRRGYTNLQPTASFGMSWQQTIPALASVVGENMFTLRLLDVTPAPYNQPPYPPSGDTDWDACSVQGIAP